MALLAPWDEFAREEDGQWRLVSMDREFSALPSEAGAPLRLGSLSLAGTPASAVRRVAGRPTTTSESLSDLSYVVVDVETTGGRPTGGDRITEIAAVVVKGGEIADVYETLVNPERSIPPMITALTNITWDMVRGAPRFRDIAEDVAAVLRGNVFVAHNAGFDWRFVATEMQRATGDQLIGRRLCTVRLARRLLPELRRRSLDHVAHYYGVEITARHRAGGDAMATARVLVRLLADARDRGCATWLDLDGFLRTPTKARRRRRSALPRPMDRDSTA